MSTLMNEKDRQQVSDAIEQLATYKTAQAHLEDGVTVHLEALPEGKHYASAWVGRSSVGRLHDDAWIAVERAVNGVRDMIDEEP